jgi:Pyrimidine dimer DNA glycosylase
MNIFYLDHDPVKCAQYHVDKHVVKMILEYCQLLSTAHRIIDGKEMIAESKTGRKVKRWKLPDHRETVLYSATHINHPSAIWCRETAGNYHWLYKLLTSLCDEYTYRYGKVHKCESTGLVNELQYAPRRINSLDQFTGPTPAMPDHCKVPNDSLQSYRNYYVMEKGRMWSWKGKINSRNEPKWFIDMVAPLTHGYS